MKRGPRGAGGGKPPRGGAPRAGETAAERKRLLLSGALVFAVACAVFGPTARASFLNWDDGVYVLENPWIRAVTWTNVRWIFTHLYFQNYLPLHILSYMADHALWGLRAGGYHLTNILIHGVNSLLCLAVVRRMSGSPAVAFVAALLFAVHPCHVEAVAWVSSRKDLLSATFMLLSLLFYLRAARRGALRAMPYAASVLFFLMAMLSKVSVVVLPAFLLLLDAVPPSGGDRARPPLLRAVATKIPYGIVGAALILVNTVGQPTAGAAYAHEPLRYLMVKGHAVWNYLALLLGFGGSPDYDLPTFAGNAANAAVQLAGLAVLPLVAYLLLRRRRRLELLGVSWTFLMLLPALAFPLVTYMADRYLYAPSVGFCWALAAALVGVATSRRVVAAALVALVAVAFSVRTVQYSRVWRDSESLWTYAMTKSSDYRVFNNLAQVRMQQKRWGEAEALLRRGTAAENVISYQSLGVLHYTLGKYDQALRETDRAIEIAAKKRSDPAVTAELHFNRGAILWLMGRSEAAAEEWRTALIQNPNHAQAREWLGIVTSDSLKSARAAAVPKR